LNKELAELISGGRQIVVEGAGHNIHLDKPEALIIPVVEMINEVREKQGKKDGLADTQPIC
jgi:pimeloyl-ACP methyl ester carboxylesterase